MSTVTVTHYGVTMTANIDSFPHCCGARILHGFRVDGPDGVINELTLEQKHKMYTHFIMEMAPQIPGIVVVADCVLNYGEWADLKRGSSQWKQGKDAGDISLEDFCEFFGFTRGPVAKNKNSGNLVASFSYNIWAADEDKNGKVAAREWKKPDFSDDKRVKKQDANVEEILAALDAAVRAASAA